MFVRFPCVVASVLFLSLAVGATRPALAQEQAGSGAQTYEGTLRWYGWQSLATDAAAAGLLGAWIHSEGNTVQLVTGISCAGLYFLGGPTVHLVNGNRGRSLASLLIRGGLPLALGTASYVVFKDPTSQDNLNGWWSFMMGVGAGMVLAPIIDSAALGWERVPPTSRSWTPSVIPASGGATFGLAGRW